MITLSKMKVILEHFVEHTQYSHPRFLLKGLYKDETEYQDLCEVLRLYFLERPSGGGLFRCRLKGE